MQFTTTLITAFLAALAAARPYHGPIVTGVNSTTPYYPTGTGTAASTAVLPTGSSTAGIVQRGLKERCGDKHALFYKECMMMPLPYIKPHHKFPPPAE
ncbi:MAG: hypothetical protein Q9182_003142 [Xanthomendoza sp. 2 TL-2023]